MEEIYQQDLVEQQLLYKVLSSFKYTKRKQQLKLIKEAAQSIQQPQTEQTFEYQLALMRKCSKQQEKVITNFLPNNCQFDLYDEIESLIPNLNIKNLNLIQILQKVKELEDVDLINNKQKDQYLYKALFRDEVINKELQNQQMNMPNNQASQGYFFKPKRKQQIYYQFQNSKPNQHQAEPEKTPTYQTNSCYKSSSEMMDIEEENFQNEKPYAKNFTNYLPPPITFVNDHKKLLNFGRLQNMMSTECSPTQSEPPNYELFKEMKHMVEVDNCYNLSSQDINFPF